MKYIVFILIALAFIPSITFAQPKNDGKGGAMSLEQMQKEPITFELDIPYAGDKNLRHRLDIYLPKKRKSNKLPVIVFFHGGAWMGGDKSKGAASLMPFVRSGQYAGVSVGYRLSGEAQWPAQIYDCKAAIRWIRANAAKYSLDPNHIGVWGGSAGGHLVLMLGVSGDTPELEGDIGSYKGVSSKVTAVANFFGVTDMLAIIGQPGDIDHASADAAEARLIGGPILENSAKANAASPITYITSNDPPVLTVHGTADRIVPYTQALRLDAALQKAGLPSYLVTVKNGGHGNFGTAADDRVKAFFDKYLRGKNTGISTRTIIWKDDK